MIRFILAVLVGLVLIGWGAWALVDWGFAHDMRNAEARCAQLDAKPQYTYRTHYICVTPDGRAVG